MFLKQLQVTKRLGANDTAVGIFPRRNLIRAMQPAAARPDKKAVGKVQKVDNPDNMPEVATPKATMESNELLQTDTSMTSPIAPNHVLVAICQQRATYRKVIENNYMYHREIYAVLRDFIVMHYAERSFSVLELGCGYASWAAKLLSGIPIERYLGYDMSETVLAEAKRNLSILSSKIELVCGKTCPTHMASILVFRTLNKI